MTMTAASTAGEENALNRWPCSPPAGTRRGLGALPPEGAEEPHTRAWGVLPRGVLLLGGPSSWRSCGEPAPKAPSAGLWGGAGVGGVSEDREARTSQVPREPAKRPAAVGGRRGPGGGGSALGPSALATWALSGDSGSVLRTRTVSWIPLLRAGPQKSWPLSSPRVCQGRRRSSEKGFQM